MVFLHTKQNTVPYTVPMGKIKTVNVAVLPLSIAGALGVTRTPDTRFRKPLLYPLSYEGFCHITVDSGCATSQAVPPPR
jgi:hypothetical protein